MQQPTHYVEARILPLDGPVLSGGDVAFVTSRIMACVHLHIVDGHEIAVSFPGIQENVEKDGNGRVVKTVGTGSVVRIFGDPASLMAFIVRPDFAQLIGGAACTVGKVPVKEVPSDPKWELLRRGRSAEKATESYAIRSDRRLRCRVEAGISHLTEEQLSERLGKIVKLNAKMPPYVNLESSSTGQRFRLFIERDAVDDFSPGTPTTYGLGVPVPAF